MYIAGEIVKIDTQEENFWVGTVINKKDDSIYEVLLTETGEILTVPESDILPVYS